MTEAGEPMDEPQGTEVKTQPRKERDLAGPLRRGSHSVLKVSQLLLRAIAAHKRLTLAALKKELRNAGYDVRRKCGRLSGEGSRSEGKGLLLWVSGSEAAGYFRICKVPKPKRKRGRPRLEEGVRSPRTPLRARNSGRRSARRTVARNVWRGRLRSDSRKVRSGAKDLVRSKTKEEGRAKKEAIRPRSRNETRPSSNAREEKKQGPEKLVKRTVQRPTSTKTHRTSHGQAKACNSRATRTRTSAKTEVPPGVHSVGATPLPPGTDAFPQSLQ